MSRILFSNLNTKIPRLPVAIISFLIAGVAYGQDENPPPTPIPIPNFETIVVEGIDELKDAIGEVKEEAELAHGEVAAKLDDVLIKPTNPVSKTWVAMKLYHRQGPRTSGGRPTLISFEGSALFILNPGVIGTNVACIFLNTDTGVVIRRQEFVLDAGAVRACGLWSEPERPVYSWAVVHSHPQYVLVDGADFPRTRSAWEKNREGMLKVYPIDCSNDVGVEFVCDLATP